MCQSIDARIVKKSVFGTGGRGDAGPGLKPANPLQVGQRRVVRPMLMVDLLPVLEMMESRWMRAWVARDSRSLRALTSRKFRLVIGSEPCVILDSASLLEAAASRFLCTSYR